MDPWMIDKLEQIKTPTTEAPRPRLELPIADNGHSKKPEPEEERVVKIQIL